jgi:hypothetical protein
MNMNDAEYDVYINSIPSVKDKVMLIMRESRYVTGWFPPYSTGATDFIEDLLADLRAEWQENSKPV